MTTACTKYSSSVSRNTRGLQTSTILLLTETQSRMSSRSVFHLRRSRKLVTKSQWGQWWRQQRYAPLWTTVSVLTVALFANIWLKSLLRFGTYSKGVYRIFGNGFLPKPGIPRLFASPSTPGNPSQINEISF